MSLFFCLSGFIIHYVYGPAFDLAPRSSAGRFFIARASRLYPLFLTVVVIGVLYYPQVSAALSADPWCAVSYLTLTGTWWYWQHEGKILIELAPIGLTWSISTEWFFYLAYAVCLYPIFRIRSVRVCTAALVLLGGFAYMVFWTIHSHWAAWEPFVLARMPDAIARSTDWPNSFFRWLYYVSPYARLFEFVGGCLVCQLFFILRPRSNSRWRNEVLFWAGAAWLVASFCLFTYAGIALDGAPVRGRSPIIEFLVSAHMNVLFAPGILLLLLGIALGCRAAYLLSLAPIVLLGEISYSIYLGHPFVAAFAFVSPTSAHQWLGIGGDMFLACVFALGLYQSIERPAKLWLRNKLNPAFLSHVAVAVRARLQRFAAISPEGAACFGDTPSGPRAVAPPASAQPDASAQGRLDPTSSVRA